MLRNHTELFRIIAEDRLVVRMTNKITSCLGIGLKDTILEMMTRRKVICLLGSVLVAAGFTPAQTGFNSSIAPNASAGRSQTARTLSVPADSPRWDLKG